MIEETYHGKLLQKEDGIYTKYLFVLDDNTYLMCTRLPNWQTKLIDIESSGYITIVKIVAGDTYFEPGTQLYKYYNYSNIYFKEFIPDAKQSKNIIL